MSEHATTGDGILTALHVLERMAATGRVAGRPGLRGDPAPAGAGQRPRRRQGARRRRPGARRGGRRGGGRARRHRPGPAAPLRHRGAGPGDGRGGRPRSRPATSPSGSPTSSERRLALPYGSSPGWPSDRSEPDHLGQRAQQVASARSGRSTTSASRSGRGGHRLPRPERRRQDHDAADAARARPRRPTGPALVGGRPYADAPGCPARVVGAALEASSFHPGRTGLGAPRGVRAPGRGRPRSAAVRCSSSSASATRPTAGSAATRPGCGSGSGSRPRCSADPPVIVLDEPANGLDPEGIVWMRALLRALRRRGPHRAGLQPRPRRGAAHRRRRRDHRRAAGWCTPPPWPSSPTSPSRRPTSRRRTRRRCGSCCASARLGARGPRAAGVVLPGVPAAEVGAAAFAAGLELHQLASRGLGPRGGLPPAHRGPDGAGEGRAARGVPQAGQHPAVVGPAARRWPATWPSSAPWWRSRSWRRTPRAPGGLPLLEGA